MLKNDRISASYKQYKIYQGLCQSHQNESFYFQTISSPLLTNDIVLQKESVIKFNTKRQLQRFLKWFINSGEYKKHITSNITSVNKGSNTDYMIVEEAEEDE